MWEGHRVPRLFPQGPVQECSGYGGGTEDRPFYVAEHDSLCQGANCWRAWMAVSAGMRSRQR